MAPKDRMLIIDDDLTFATVLSMFARSHGFAPEQHSSLIDLGSFARVREFDIAVIDYYLGSIRGDEIAEYVEMFFKDVPVIIVSSRDFTPTEVANWPAAVRKFVPKSAGGDEIVHAAREVLDRARFLRRLAQPGSQDQSAPSGL